MTMGWTPRAYKPGQGAGAISYGNGGSAGQGQSAKSHALSLHERLYAKQLQWEGFQGEVYAVSGTPADCVKLAVTTLMPQKPQLICSGINRGSNAGTDILYSGTVAAAMEGAFFNIPAVAISAAPYASARYELAAMLAPQLAEAIAKTAWPPKVILNVNVPSLPKGEVKGIKWVGMGICHYDEYYQVQKDEQGRTCYVLKGAFRQSDAQGKGVDVYWLPRGYVTLSLLCYDMTYPKPIKGLTDWTFDLGEWMDKKGEPADGYQGLFEGEI
jgi:5'-nucleotidase